MKTRGFLNAFSLKLILAAMMLLDHIYYFLQPQPLWFTVLGRLVAPTFAFLMTQSLIFTHDRKAYIRRLALAGLLMLAGSTALQILYGDFIDNMVFLSLAVSAKLLDIVEDMRENGINITNVALLILMAALSLLLEGGALYPVMALIFYYLRERRILMCAVFSGASVLLCYLFGYPNLQMLMVLASVLILLYNGERGSNSVFARWFFYLFYPLHVWALYILAHLR